MPKPMLSEDYFMRMINQLLAVLVQILYHKEAGQYQEAQNLIDQSLEQLLGVRAELLHQMDEASILRILTAQEEIDLARLEMVAELYRIEGDLLAEQGLKARSHQDYLRAMTFYLEIGLAPGVQSAKETNGKIDQLSQLVSGYELPIEVLFMLFDYHEKRGEFGRLEEHVTALLRKNDQLPEILPNLNEYYQAKSEMSDDDLEAGGISRSVVETRLAELRIFGGYV